MSLGCVCQQVFWHLLLQHNWPAWLQAWFPDQGCFPDTMWPRLNENYLSIFIQGQEKGLYLLITELQSSIFPAMKKKIYIRYDRVKWRKKKIQRDEKERIHPAVDSCTGCVPWAILEPVQLIVITVDTCIDSVSFLAGSNKVSRGSVFLICTIATQIQQAQSSSRFQSLSSQRTCSSCRMC